MKLKVADQLSDTDGKIRTPLYQKVTVKSSNIVCAHL